MSTLRLLRPMFAALLLLADGTLLKTAGTTRWLA